MKAPFDYQWYDDIMEWIVALLMPLMLIGCIVMLFLFIYLAFTGQLT